jgi:hypothetical protein
VGQLLSAIAGGVAGNIGAQQGQGQAEASVDTARNNEFGDIQDMVSNFLGQYAKMAPMMLNPAALETVNAPTVGSVYGGFDPGQVPGLQGGQPGGRQGPVSTQWKPPQMPSAQKVG